MKVQLLIFALVFSITIEVKKVKQNRHPKRVKFSKKERKLLTVDDCEKMSGKENTGCLAAV